MTDSPTKVARDELDDIVAVLPLALRDRLASIVIPMADKIDDVASLLDYRRRIAVEGLVSPVGETDPYMQGLADALAVVLRAREDATTLPGSVLKDALGRQFDKVASALAELGYQRTDPDPVVNRDNSRGMGRMVNIPGAYGGGVDVYESSAASWPHLWLKAQEHVNPNDRDSRLKEVIVHLRAESAWLLARQLCALVQQHYHDVDLAELTTPAEGDEVVAYYDNGSSIGTVVKLTEDGELGLMNTPLANADAVFVIRKADGE
jgi:hypothetical protein